jgi:hypothetical protein
VRGISCCGANRGLEEGCSTVILCILCIFVYKLLKN